VTAYRSWRPTEDRWRAVNAPHLVALVRAGARFERGLLVERDLVTDITPYASEPSQIATDREQSTNSDA
jgi:hypothetical protein